MARRSNFHCTTSAELFSAGVSPFRGNGETLYLFVLTQFLTENRVTLFLELLWSWMISVQVDVKSPG
jgi:hypothetical protein